jgi:hypothetical protein
LGIFFNGSETVSDYADFLLGAPNYYVQCTEQFQDNRSRYGGFFVQDSWKAKRNLALNLGLLWDIAMPWYDTQGKTETIIKGEQSTVFPLSPLSYVVPGDPGVPSTVSPTGFRNFAPRLGLAYQPSGGDGFLGKVLGGPGKTSIRAAYGISLLLRMEFFNIFNHTNFMNPVGNITNSGQFGQVISSRHPRIGQIAAKVVF